MRFGEHIAGEGDLAGAHDRFWVEIDRPGLSRFRQGLVYSLWHCLEMIPCLCAAIRALSPETGLPGSRPPRPGSEQPRTRNGS